MGLPYIPQYCTFDDLPDYAQKNEQGNLTTSSERRQHVRDALRFNTCFKTSDYAGSRNFAESGCSFSALDAVANDQCCHPVVKNALEKLLDIVELRGTAGTGVGDGSDYQLNILMNRCIYAWPDIGVNDKANKDRGQKQRIVRYCAQKASDYYNELYEAYSACRLRISPANFNEESTNEVNGCMDETAINYDPTATTSLGIGGICEYADDNQWGATNDEGDTRPDTATDSLGYEVSVAYQQEQGKDEYETDLQVNSLTCWSGCPNPMGRSYLNGQCTAEFPYDEKPMCGGKDENLTLDALSARIAEIAEMLASQGQPQTANEESEIVALRSELESLQLLMQQNQGGSGYVDPLPAPQQAGVGIPPWAIIAGLGVIAVILLVNKRGAKQAVPAV